MNSQTALNTAANTVLSKRKAHMNKIRQSLKTTPLLQQNINLTRKRLSEKEPEAANNGSRQSTPDSGNQRVSLENYEIFEEKYQLLEKLGEGANGVVHKCRKRQTGE